MKKFLLICLLLSCGSASAALNKWVDAQGNIHYSDTQPPPGVESKTLRNTSSSDDIYSDETEENPNNEGSGNTLQSIAEREAERKRAKLEKQKANTKAAKEQANAEKLNNYCKSARENLTALKANIRLTAVDDNGERSFMSDEEKQKSVMKIQQSISKHCN
ncbi:MAG: DUF4124 domain-containing protein [Gallionella sp.]